MPALAYTYFDPYLIPMVTIERENRALVDVNTYRTDYPAAWLEKLTRLRAYVIVCQESQKTSEDLFSVKLSQYQKEFDKLLPMANIAADAAAAALGTAEARIGSFVSIELFRA